MAGRHRRAPPGEIPYAAASAGVEHAARTRRLELEGTGIRVSVVRCGETAGTEFSAREQATGRSGAASALALSPVAPPGDQPATFDGWGADMMRRYVHGVMFT